MALSEHQCDSCKKWIQWGPGTFRPDTCPFCKGPSCKPLIEEGKVEEVEEEAVTYWIRIKNRGYLERLGFASLHVPDGIVTTYNINDIRDFTTLELAQDFIKDNKLKNAVVWKVTFSWP